MPAAIATAPLHVVAEYPFLVERSLLRVSDAQAMLAVRQRSDWWPERWTAR